MQAVEAAVQQEFDAQMVEKGVGGGSAVRHAQFAAQIEAAVGKRVQPLREGQLRQVEHAFGCFDGGDNRFAAFVVHGCDVGGALGFRQHHALYHVQLRERGQIGGKAGRGGRVDAQPHRAGGGVGAIGFQMAYGIIFFMFGHCVFPVHHHLVRADAEGFGYPIGLVAGNEQKDFR